MGDFKSWYYYFLGNSDHLDHLNFNTRDWFRKNRKKAPYSIYPTISEG